MTHADAVIAAMRAGLNGQALPNFGDQLPRDVLGLVNAVYDEARNWSAGTRTAKERH